MFYQARKASGLDLGPWESDRLLTEFAARFLDDYVRQILGEIEVGRLEVFGYVSQVINMNLQFLPFQSLPLGTRQSFHTFDWKNTWCRSPTLQQNERCIWVKHTRHPTTRARSPGAEVFCKKNTWHTWHTWHTCHEVRKLSGQRTFCSFVILVTFILDSNISTCHQWPCRRMFLHWSVY